MGGDPQLCKTPQNGVQKFVLIIVFNNLFVMSTAPLELVPLLVCRARAGT